MIKMRNVYNKANITGCNTHSLSALKYVHSVRLNITQSSVKLNRSLTKIHSKSLIIKIGAKLNSTAKKIYSNPPNGSLCLKITFSLPKSVQIFSKREMCTDSSERGKPMDPTKRHSLLAFKDVHSVHIHNYKPDFL